MNEAMPHIAMRARSLLAAAGDPVRAGSMAAYMKTEMPFFGVSSPDRTTISRTLAREFPAATRSEYEHNVRLLWRGSHREEKYLAIAYARSFPRYVTVSSIPIYRMMISQGAWWDFVDEVAAHLVGSVLAKQRARFTPTIEDWTTSDDLWLRRTAIISQLRHKDATDVALLGTACTVNLSDTEFFIRKAIGWALREFAKTDPVWVVGYVLDHEGEMSGLTRREATKHLGS